ncbi:MAG: sugar ABC transporter permease, partial [Clostridia bacterium]|nr:sugar ABC transporter permease [Clostridia bacterium]
YDKDHQIPANLFTWVGLDNFANMLGGNAQLGYTFLNLFVWTIVWAVFATFTNYLFGMILALMINKKGIRLKKFWRTVFILTIAVPQFVSLMLMSQILADEGALNVALRELGWNTESIPFLTNGTLAKIVVVAVNMWVGIPYTMLITSGILMNIPEDMYESARIDGAGPVRMFFRITLPYMLFVTTPYLITQFVNNINNFNVIYLLTRGGPLTLDYYKAGKTDLLVTWLYKQTVEEQNYNLAAVIGVIVFLITATCSLLVYNSSASAKKEEEFQ